VAKIPLDFETDGMDLSHNFFKVPGKDRKLFSMAFEGSCYFVRDERFRLHEDGRFYEVPVTRNETRYRMKVIEDPSGHQESRKDLQTQLEAYMQIRKSDRSYQIVPFGTKGDQFKNTQDRKSEKAGETK